MCRDVISAISAISGIAAIAAIACITALLAACDQDLREQARLEAGEISHHFPDRRADRPPPPGAVPQGAPPPDPARETGRVGGAPASIFPFEVTADDLARGRSVYDIHCAPCHDPLGTGVGMVVRQGHPPAASFHIERLRTAPPGYFVETARLGRGLMPPFGDRIPGADLWRVTAWLRVLQRSQRVEVSRLSPAERARLAEAD